MKKILCNIFFCLCAVNAFSQSKDECLEFLYRYMPLPDKVDYSRDYYEQNVLVTLQAQAEMPWGRTIPKREFMHFVLPVRVNNENLDTCRMVFYRELKQRVRNMSMTDAVLEVNHWCHEHVTYTPSDERTSSPLASIRTAYGRCGEESTLLVAALRAVGIPARQVYTPRWAHTDDNHAWVEAWADGKWHFLGACEPEPVLDLGWFNAPASRGMLMHTKVFGHYDGPEEIMQQNDCFTEIDVTSNYAPVSRRHLKVVDEHGAAVAGATVEFKIYNYAEFFTVSKKLTNADGMTCMQSGIGDLLVWAYKDDKYNYAKFSMVEQDTLILTLSRKSGGDAFSDDISVTPPVERNTLPFVSDDMRRKNDQRLAEEDAMRNAYVASFPQTDNILVKKSRGNYTVIQSFLDTPSLPLSPYKFLSTLTDKDLRDVTADVLSASTRCISANKYDYPEDIYYRYVLCPRVANEGLTPYMPALRSASARHRFKDVEDISTWVRRNIRIEERSNPQHLRMSPMGVYRSRLCDAVSRNIFFVALSRVHGIASRIDAVTQKVEYYSDGNWVAVDFEAEKQPSRMAAKGMLCATYKADEYNTNPKYYTHFTISRLDNGVPELLNYPEDATWESTLSTGARLDVGQYLLTSGTRLADGSALVHIAVDIVRPDETTMMPLVIPSADSDGCLPVIGAFNSENRYHDSVHGDKSILSTTGRGFYILGVVAPNNEPTNHALRDIAAVKDDFEALGTKMVLLFSDAEAFSRFDVSDFPPLPNGSSLGWDIDGSVRSKLYSDMHLSQSEMPVFVIADTFNRIVFISKGYTIGLGERLVKNMRQLR